MNSPADLPFTQPAVSHLPPDCCQPPGKRKSPSWRLATWAARMGCQPPGKRRFHAEAKAIARLQHPHIVQIHELGEHNRIPYCALEFCSGGDLTERLRGGPLPPPEAAALLQTLAKASRQR